jgi:hypothetical protein
VFWYNNTSRTYPIKIEIGDGTLSQAWSGTTTVTGTNVYWEASFTAKTGRYVKITMTGANGSGSNWFSMWETEIHGDACTQTVQIEVIADPTQGGSVTPTGSKAYCVNTYAPITATPSPGWFFSSWYATSQGIEIADYNAAQTQMRALPGATNGFVYATFINTPIPPAPIITVTSPNGGEVWEVSVSKPITWTSTGTVGNVDIAYSTNGGTTWTTIISNTANDGLHNWIVPNAVSSNCRIRVQEPDGTPTDMSNSSFSIIQPPAGYWSPNSYGINYSGSGRVGMSQGTDGLYLTGDSIVFPGSRSQAIWTGGKIQLAVSGGGQTRIEAGKIQTEEIIVSNAWSDYVFNRGYKLMPLDSVERFITANKHLPGIPSADEVNKNGINVGVAQANLLAKIEELTLYTIQLKKEIDELKNHDKK